jgi:hypothetical protein
MSFDIFFQTCRFATEPVETKNPFTGKVEKLNRSSPLDEAELAAVREALVDRGRATGPDDAGNYAIDLADGGSAEVYAENLRDGCMFAIGNLTSGLTAILYDVLDAGRWVMLPAIETSIAITCSPQHVNAAPADFPRIVTCRSSQELAQLLSGGFDSWNEYRNSVV